jgi:hypothetical protein
MHFYVELKESQIARTRKKGTTKTQTKGKVKKKEEKRRNGGNWLEESNKKKADTGAERKIWPSHTFG